jgi:hypothetical protein
MVDSLELQFSKFLKPRENILLFSFSWKKFVHVHNFFLPGYDIFMYGYFEKVVRTERQDY